jgi:Zn finger protein HypA/HybF involved in hydrogenase expression
MPTADCRCSACVHTFVHLTFKGDDIAPVCPRCKHRDVDVQTDPDRFMAGPGLGSMITDVPKGPS